MKKFFLFVCLLGVFGCGNNSITEDNSKVGLANPASTHCADVGGKLTIKTNADGGQYGICYFEDNRQCEEWALFRGECPIGGLKITGYDTEEQVYCAIRGGTVNMGNKTCTLPDGEVANLTE